MTTTVAKKAGALPAPVLDGLKLTMPSAYKLLPPDVAPERFQASVWLHLQQSPGLQECYPDTILAGCVRAATDGLLPGIECFLLPFKKKASYVRHYHGLIKMLERTGKVRRAFAHPVYQGDHFEVDYFSERPSHTPYLVLGTEPGNIRFYYGAVILKDGTCHFRVVSLEYIESVRRRAPGAEQEPWQHHPVEMACKTALKYTCQFVQITPAIQAALAEEDAAPPAPPTLMQHQKNVADLYGDVQPRSHGGWRNDPLHTPGLGDDLHDDGWRTELREGLTILPEAHPFRAQADAALQDASIPPGQGRHLVGTLHTIIDGMDTEAS